MPATSSPASRRRTATATIARTSRQAVVSGPDQTGEQDNPGQHDNPGNGRAGDPLGLEGDNNNDAADDPDEEVTLAIPGVSVSGVSPDREAAEDVE